MATTIGRIRKNNKKGSKPKTQEPNTSVEPKSQE